MNIKYIIDQKIDNGTDGEIFLAARFNNNLFDKNVVIKRYVYEMDNFINPLILRELAVLTKSKSPYIIKLLDVYYDNNYIYVVLESEGMHLLNNIIQGKIDDNNKFPIMLEIIESINYLHSMGYIHGDINFKNILFSYERGCKLIDFCSSTKLHRNTIVFTPAIYVCPYEIVKQTLIFSDENDNNNDVKITNMKALDMWMVGCNMYFLATQMPLFLSTDEKSQLEIIKQNIGIEYNIYRKKNNGTINHDIGIEHNFFKEKNNGPLQAIKNTNYEPIKQLMSLSPNNRKDIKFLCENYKNDLKLFNIDVSNNNLYNYEKTKSIRLLDKKYSKKYINDIIIFVRKLMLFYKNINKYINIESIFLTLKNIKNLTNNVNTIKEYQIISFWLSNKMVNKHTEENNMNFLIKLLQHFDVNLQDQKIKEITFDICEKLEWDLDPITAYDYVIDIPNKLKQHFIFSLFVIFLDFQNIYINELCKYILIVCILNVCFQIDLEPIKSLIKKAYDDNFIDKTYLTCNCVEMLLSMMHFQQNNTDTICTDVFDDNIIEWFNNLDFKKLYAEISSQIDLF